LIFAAAAPSGAFSIANLLSQAQGAVAARTVVFSKLVDTGGNLAISLAVSLIILLLTFWAAGWAAKLTRQAFGRLSLHRRPDAMLQSFAASLVRNVVLIIGLIEVLQQLGIRTTSIIAVLGAVSLAIGLALQGALANVAAGVLILVFRPFRVGDRVCIAGREGVVRALEWFTTEIADPGNVRVIVPNGKVFGDVIVNYTRHENRRIEINFGIDFADDVDLALKLLVEAAEADPRVLKEPPPWARMTRIGDQGPIVTLRAWMSPDDFWNGRFDLTKQVFDRFKAEGLHFPYPHQTGLSREEQMALPAGEVQPPSA
jgi:small conductance mechanosensitive channel